MLPAKMNNTIAPLMVVFISSPFWLFALNCANETGLGTHLTCASAVAQRDARRFAYAAQQTVYGGSMAAYQATLLEPVHLACSEYVLPRRDKSQPPAGLG